MHLNDEYISLHCSGRSTLVRFTNKSYSVCLKEKDHYILRIQTILGQFLKKEYNLYLENTKIKIST